MNLCFTSSVVCRSSFLFNAPLTTAIYTLSLHDALPISGDPIKVKLVAYLLNPVLIQRSYFSPGRLPSVLAIENDRDRKSTRLNSSHVEISYAVFCLKKKTAKHEALRT